MELLDLLAGFLCVAVFGVIYAGSAAWAVGDAQRRGYDTGVIALLFWLFGPFSALIWLAARPKTKLEARLPTEYTDAEDAIAAAARLDSLGDWDAAISLYQHTAQRWPEHENYIQQCIKAIAEKRGMS